MAISHESEFDARRSPPEGGGAPSSRGVKKYPTLFQKKGRMGRRTRKRGLRRWSGVTAGSWTATIFLRLIQQFNLAFQELVLQLLALQAEGDLLLECRLADRAIVQTSFYKNSRSRQRSVFLEGEAVLGLR